MKVYIAGSITRDPDYKRKFADAARQLESYGFIVLNPAVLPSGMKPEDYMRICFAMIDVADSVLMLPNWNESAGAALEADYCEYIGKPVETIRSKPWFNDEAWRTVPE